MTTVRRAQTHRHARLANDYCTTCTDTHTHTRMTREQLLYDVHTHARLLHDYYTTCTNTNIDRYTHTYIHTHKTHTHTHTHIQHTHTHIHTQHKKRRTTLQQKCVVQQEATNYVAAEVGRAARSGELRSCGPKVTGGKGSGSRL
jgi:hypothetical protein